MNIRTIGEYSEPMKCGGHIMMVMVKENEELALLKYLLNKYLSDKNKVIISYDETLIVGEMKYIEIPPTCYEELDIKMELSRYKIFNEKVQ